MSRSRNIKPGFFKNEDLAKCEPLARILFAALWCEADRDGRLEDRPSRLKIECLPYDDCDVDRLLSQLACVGLIVRYIVASIALIEIPKFAKHQNPHKNEAPSLLPSSGDSGATLVQVRCDSGATPVLVPENSVALRLIPSSLIPSSLIPDPLIPASGNDPEAGAPPDDEIHTPKRKGAMVTLTQWLDSLADDEFAIPFDDPIVEWAKSQGIDPDWIGYAWEAFADRYGASGLSARKKYIDWRATFRNAVKGDWLKIWYSRNGVHTLTTVGEQWQRAAEASA